MTEACSRCYIHKRHPIARPHGRAMGEYFLRIWVKIVCVIMALYSISTNVPHLRHLFLEHGSWIIHIPSCIVYLNFIWKVLWHCVFWDKHIWIKYIQTYLSKTPTATLCNANGVLNGFGGNCFLQLLSVLSYLPLQHKALCDHHITKLNYPPHQHSWVIYQIGITPKSLRCKVDFH